MYKIYILISLSLTTLFAHNAKKEFYTYYESIDFKNSIQKYNGQVTGIGSNIKIENSQYQFTYEYGDTNTKQPPLSKDLKVEKLFLKYTYFINSKWIFNANHINILRDNIAMTTYGKAYGIGVTYKFSEKTSLNFTKFLLNYEDFRVKQSDISLNHNIEFQGMKIRLTAITKVLYLKDKRDNSFTKFAKDNYLTTAFKLHSHYNSYHLGFGVYFGKRAFAIMKDGLKIQHHAMEFDRTLSAGVGKSFNDVTLRVQYIYQRAIELPVQNGKKVDIKNTRIMANYKF